MQLNKQYNFKRKISPKTIKHQVGIAYITRRCRSLLFGKLGRSCHTRNGIRYRNKKTYILGALSIRLDYMNLSDMWWNKLETIHKVNTEIRCIIGEIQPYHHQNIVQHFTKRVNTSHQSRSIICWIFYSILNWIMPTTKCNKSINAHSINTCFSCYLKYCALNYIETSFIFKKTSKFFACCRILG